MKYHFNEIEAKWQKYWFENQTFKADNTSEIMMLKQKRRFMVEP